MMSTTGITTRLESSRTSLTTVAIVIGVIMGAALVYGFTQGDFMRDGAALLSNPWGKVTLVETYIGYALVGLWIGARERSPWVAGAWTVCLCFIGHLVTAAYLLLVARRARNSAR